MPLDLSPQENQTKLIDYSIVIPVYNEEGALQLSLSELLQTIAQLVPYEVIFIDDGSTDQSPVILQDFKQEFPEVVRIISLSERRGQTFALRQGLDQVRGKIAITLDADLQNDPVDIPRLLEKMKEGYDCVCGWRKSRQDKLIKACLSKLGNLIQRMLTGMGIHDVSCTLRAYKKECVGSIPLNWEGQHRFIPMSLSLQGFLIGEIVSNHRQRKFDRSKYGHRRIFKVVLDFIKILRTRGKG